MAEHRLPLHYLEHPGFGEFVSATQEILLDAGYKGDHDIQQSPIFFGWFVEELTDATHDVEFSRTILEVAAHTIQLTTELSELTMLAAIPEAEQGL